METPVLFLIFNRPDSTKSVFEQIRIAQPKQLFIAADGPRKGNESDLAKCAATIEIVTNSIDWDCEVRTLFRTENLGCGRAVSESISWFFDNVDKGIILEDDCLPSQDFFKFCTSMLTIYQEDDNVMHISGCNLNDCMYGNDLYYFSSYANIWGWATWKRAWANYNYAVEDIFEKRPSLKKNFNDPFERKFWVSVYDVLHSRNLDTWDYQWILSIIKLKGKCINSNYNLISNIGFNSEATHTSHIGPQANRQYEFIPWDKPIHKTNGLVNPSADIDLMKNIHGVATRGYFKFFIQRFKNLLHKLHLMKN